MTAMTPDLKQVVLLLRAHRIAIHVPPTNDSYSRRFDLCQEAANAIERLSSEVGKLRQGAGVAAGRRRELPVRAEAAEGRLEATPGIDRGNCAPPMQPNNGMENDAQLTRVNAELRREILTLLQELENWRKLGRAVRAIANENRNRRDCEGGMRGAPPAIEAGAHCQRDARLDD
jgi:hypothetical protein